VAAQRRTDLATDDDVELEIAIEHDGGINTATSTAIRV
jgi:hypothetical protein